MLRSAKALFSAHTGEAVVPPSKGTAGMIKPEHFVCEPSNLRWPSTLDFSSSTFRLHNVALLEAVPRASVQSVDLSGNELTTLELINRFQALRTLVAASNQLQVGGGLVLRLPKLVELDLGSNRLVALPALTEMPQLQVLRLARNQIARNWGELSVTANCLRELDVSNNRLNWQQPTGEFDAAMGVLASLRKLKELRLGGNPVSDTPALVRLSPPARTLRALPAGTPSRLLSSRLLASPLLASPRLASPPLSSSLLSSPHLASSLRSSPRLLRGWCARVVRSATSCSPTLPSSRASMAPPSPSRSAAAARSPEAASPPAHCALRRSCRLATRTTTTTTQTAAAAFRACHRPAAARCVAPVTRRTWRRGSRSRHSPARARCRAAARPTRRTRIVTRSHPTGRCAAAVRPTTRTTARASAFSSSRRPPELRAARRRPCGRGAARAARRTL
jgi:hypothetical protein